LKVKEKENKSTFNFRPFINILRKSAEKNPLEIWSAFLLDYIK